MRYLIVLQKVSYGYSDYEDADVSDSYYDPEPVALFYDKKDAENKVKELEQVEDDRDDRWGHINFHILDLKYVKIG